MRWATWYRWSCPTDRSKGTDPALLAGSSLYEAFCHAATLPGSRELLDAATAPASRPDVPPTAEHLAPPEPKTGSAAAARDISESSGLRAAECRPCLTACTGGNNGVAGADGRDDVGSGVSLRLSRHLVRSSAAGTDPGQKEEQRYRPRVGLHACGEPIPVLALGHSPLWPWICPRPP